MNESILLNNASALDSVFHKIDLYSRLGIAVCDNEDKMVQLNGNQTGSILTYYILTRWKEFGKLDSTKYIAKTIVTTEQIADRIAPLFKDVDGNDQRPGKQDRDRKIAGRLVDVVWRHYPEMPK